jgi:hypothetical protein
VGGSVGLRRSHRGEMYIAFTWWAGLALWTAVEVDGNDVVERLNKYR